LFAAKGGLLSFEYVSFNLSKEENNLIFFATILQIRNIHLHPEMLTLENGLATPTMKVKRNEVRNYFKKVIEDLYAETKLWSKL
jgi:long-subunit acyl-CoA synthetase (AMP-forming)